MEIEVVAICTNGRQAVQAVVEKRPQLLFLDVQMPGMDGFQVLEGIQNVRLPEIVFITAYDRYAIQAFEVHAVDYLLKPFDRDRFSKALERAKELIRHNSERHLTKQLQALREEIQTRPRYLDRLVIKTGGRIYFLKSQQIDWIEAQGKYIAVHSGKESHVVRESMSAVEADLDPRKFARIHRSTIVNLDRIKEIQSWFHGDCKVLLQDGTELMLSRSFRPRLETLLGRSI
jgi:two-component system, LytTR family, response regulator